MMERRDFLAGAAALAASPALAQTPTLPPVAAGATRIVLTTGLGPIVLDLRGDKAPITTANFLKYVDRKLLNGAQFYRAMHTPVAPGQPPADTGLIQGGLSNNHAERFLPPIAHESTTQTGLRHKDGTISLARLAPGSATAEFFICIGDTPYLDADPNAPGDNLGFAAFGQVVDGMDVVKKSLAAPTSPTKGEGVMKGQMLDPPVPIITAARAI